MVRQVIRVLIHISLPYSIYENKVDYADGDGNKLTSMQNQKSSENKSGLKWERTSSWECWCLTLVSLMVA